MKNIHHKLLSIQIVVFISCLLVTKVTAQSLDNLDALNGFWSFKFYSNPNTYTDKIVKAKQQGDKYYLQFYDVLSPEKYKVDGVESFNVALDFYKNQLQKIQINFSIDKTKMAIQDKMNVDSDLDKIFKELKKLFGEKDAITYKEKGTMSDMTVFKWKANKVTCYFSIVTGGLLDTKENLACWVIFESNSLTNQLNLEEYN